MPDEFLKGAGNMDDVKIQQAGEQTIEIAAGKSVTVEWFRGRDQRSRLRFYIFQSDLWRLIGQIDTPDNRDWNPYAPLVDIGGNLNPLGKKTIPWKIKVEADVSDGGGTSGYRVMYLSAKFPRDLGGIRYTQVSFYSNSGDPPNTEIRFHIF
jgi:hypothetical protein